MKSSIITTSSLAPSSGPGSALPLVIRTLPITASSKTTPKKDWLASPGEDGTKPLNSTLPSASKYWSCVLPRPPNFLLLPSGRSTSVKTAPKPATVAGSSPLLPGMKKKASVRWLPTGVKSRSGLNAAKIVP